MKDINGKPITQEQIDAALHRTFAFVTGDHLVGLTMDDAIASEAEVVGWDNTGAIILLGYRR